MKSQVVKLNYSQMSGSYKLYKLITVQIPF